MQVAGPGRKPIYEMNNIDSHLSASVQLTILSSLRTTTIGHSSTYRKQIQSQLHNTFSTAQMGKNWAEQNSPDQYSITSDNQIHKWRDKFQKKVYRRHWFKQNREKEQLEKVKKNPRIQKGDHNLARIWRKQVWGGGEGKLTGPQGKRQKAVLLRSCRDTGVVSLHRTWDNLEMSWSDSELW